MHVGNNFFLSDKFVYLLSSRKQHNYHYLKSLDSEPKNKDLQIKKSSEIFSFYSTMSCTEIFFEFCYIPKINVKSFCLTVAESTHFVLNNFDNGSEFDPLNSMIKDSCLENNYISCNFIGGFGKGSRSGLIGKKLSV